MESIDEKKAYHHKYYLAHKEDWQSRRRARYQANPEEYKRKAKEFHRMSRYSVLSHYSDNPPKCACCEEITLEFLTIDHMNNNGAEERRKLFGTKGRGGGGHTFYRWLINHNFPEGYQVLCMNCNFAKGKYGKCPHVGDKR